MYFFFAHTVYFNQNNDYYCQNNCRVGTYVRNYRRLLHMSCPLLFLNQDKHFYILRTYKTQKVSQLQKTKFQ
jgi:nitroimidazol reductase NimA-like FMN-containing flavoprotein (pyridoxamine 5'-phosphate oxidase superfamily)